MKDEIKEILDDFKWYIEQKNEQDINGEYEYPRELTQEEAKILLDYITNLQEENEDLREENKEAHDFDETMKDIKDNLIARINRQECEIHDLKAKLEMYENGVYFSSENDELQQRIDKALSYLGINEEILETCEIYDVNGIEVYKILQGSEKE